MADGIEVYRQLSPYVMQSYEYLYGENPSVAIGGVAVEPGFWYPVDAARARERVVDTARKVMKHRYDVFTSHAALLDELFSDLADLDAAEGGAGK